MFVRRASAALLSTDVAFHKWPHGLRGSIDCLTARTNERTTPSASPPYPMGHGRTCPRRAASLRAMSERAMASEAASEHPGSADINLWCDLIDFYVDTNRWEGP